VLVARGRLDEARELAEAAVELTADTVDIVLRADALIDLAMILIWAGRRSDAEAPIREALELYERKGASVAAERARHLLDEVGVAG
jgi:Flp pilus assembly protein TadD